MKGDDTTFVVHSSITGTGQLFFGMSSNKHPAKQTDLDVDTLIKIRAELNVLKDVEAVSVSQRIQPEASATSTQPRLLYFWEMFRFVLTPKIRRDTYEPAYNDLLSDYLIAQNYKTAGQKRWLKFCFAVRTIFMVFDCLWQAGGSILRRAIVPLIPEIVRRLFGG